MFMRCQTIQRAGIRLAGCWAAVLLVACATADEAYRLPFIADTSVAAVVDGRTIYFGEVRKALDEVPFVEPETDRKRARRLAAALDVVVNRRLVLDHLRTRGWGAEPVELEAALSLLREQLVRDDQTLDDVYQSLDLNSTEFRARLDWKLSWKKYAVDQLSEEKLLALMQGPLAEFDGSLRRVSHILLREGDGDFNALLEQAARIRTEIVSGELDFAAAARKYSQAPSAADGGDLGWIRREGPMVEAFSAAAYALEIGQISEPVASPFGVHLIRCTRAAPAEAADLRRRLPYLQAAAEQRLFADLAEQQRRQARIDFSGACPYRDAATGELHLPPSG